MLTKSFTKQQNLEQLQEIITTPDVGQEDNAAANMKEKKPERTKKIKPFQVQLVKVNKKAKEASEGTEPDKQENNPVRIVKNAMQVGANIGNVDKRELMMYLMGKLGSIQSRAEEIKQNLNETGPQSKPNQWKSSDT